VDITDEGIKQAALEQNSKDEEKSGIIKSSDEMLEGDKIISENQAKSDE
jgi:hypothetical protein